MGKLSRLRMLGVSLNERVNSASSKLKANYDNHIQSQYPKIEEDSEGISIWESPKKVRMEFKTLTPQQGYDKTTSKFNKLHLTKFIRCYIEDTCVVIEY
jgi:hypothetical protein